MHKIVFVVDALKLVIWSYAIQFGWILFTQRPASYVNNEGQVRQLSPVGENVRQLLGLHRP